MWPDPSDPPQRELLAIARGLGAEVGACTHHMDAISMKRAHFATYAVANMRTAEGKTRKKPQEEREETAVVARWKARSQSTTAPRQVFLRAQRKRRSPTSHAVAFWDAT